MQQKPSTRSHLHDLPSRASSSLHGSCASSPLLSDLEISRLATQEALSVDPMHMETLENYAIFLEEVRGDLDGAEHMYNRYDALLSLALHKPKTHLQTCLCFSHRQTAIPRRSRLPLVSFHFLSPGLLNRRKWQQEIH